MNCYFIPVCTICVLVTSVAITVYGHGRLLEPAGRGSLWRFPEYKKLEPPQDYDDNQLSCGGFNTHYLVNNGKCGVCGDAWNLPEPRPHEDGGQFGKGIIAKNYTSGQQFQVQVQLTASHLGFFEFRLCPRTNNSVPVTQECLDKYLLPLANGSGSKYNITTFDPMLHKYNLTLPSNLTCAQCVLQWNYRVGYNYDFCPDGSYRKEQFNYLSLEKCP